MSFSKYERSESINSKYCYEDSDVLINKLGLKDIQTLKEAEISFTTQRTIELYESPIKGKFSATHLKNIHRHLFQDLYPFAGKFRQENIYKGDTMFCRCEHIEDNLNRLLLELKNEKYLIALDKTVFCERLTFYFSELNLIHPFREGNGRTLREFIRQLVLNARYKIDWVSVNSNELLNAMIESVTNTSILNKLLFEIIV